LDGNYDNVVWFSARGLTDGEISTHLGEIYGAEVSKQTISAITDRVMEEMGSWQNRPLDAVYPVIFIDTVNVKIREGNVANRPIYVVLAVTVEGKRDILGLWAGEHGDGEGAKYWMRVLTEIKSRGTQDCLIVVCDGLKGLPEASATVWPQTIVQTCLVRLLRISFKYASKKDWATIVKDLKPVCTALSESPALDVFAEFSQTFFWFDQEIRTIICTTNAWKGALNAFEITFDGRCPPHGSNTPARSSYTVNFDRPNGSSFEPDRVLGHSSQGWR
jgi:transposase-like protein